MKDFTQYQNIRFLNRFKKKSLNGTYRYKLVNFLGQPYAIKIAGRFICPFLEKQRNNTYTLQKNKPNRNNINNFQLPPDIYNFRWKKKQIKSQ